MICNLCKPHTVFATATRWVPPPDMFILPAKPPDDYGFIRFRLAGLQCGIRPDGTWQDGTHRAFAMAGIAATLSKLAFDACMFNSQNFGFIKLPDQFTTGSSIMPHKKNPDVFELTRAKCNKLQSLPQQIMMIANNLPSGYFRDLQIIKEVFLPAFRELKDCLQMTTYIMNEIKSERTYSG